MAEPRPGRARGGHARRPVATGNRRFAEVAMLCSAAMMAFQVASRATRDALFLSTHGPDALPGMVAVAAAVAIALALSASRALARWGPARAMPFAFAAGALLTLAEWPLAARAPGWGGVAVWIHVAALGPVLLSGFWSILNERFDPRTARRVIGRIAASGTLGGLAGGLLAERSASWLGLAGTLPVLAGLQGTCALLLHRLPEPLVRSRNADPDPVDGPALAQVARTPYLRNLALLVLGTSVSAGLLDWIFKAAAATALPTGPALLRTFAAYYAAVAVLTFVLQAGLTRAALGGLGLVPSIGALPAFVAAGGIVSAVVPGAGAIAIVRGLEAVLRGSLFRSGYELLFTPIPPAEKRGTKAILDVGFDRLGDLLGAGLVAWALTLPASPRPIVLLGLTVLAALGTLAVVARLRRGYVASLEAGLRAGAVELASVDLPDWSLVGTLSGAQQRPGVATDPATAHPPADEDGRANQIAPDPTPRDALQSRDPDRVRAALEGPVPLTPELVPRALELLAWDEVAHAAGHALRAVAVSHSGVLVDALLDPGTDFAVRRRLPPILAVAPTVTTLAGLLAALGDARFEVRYRCGRALHAVLRASPGLHVEPGILYAAAQREALVSQSVWKTQHLLGPADDPEPDPALGDWLRLRADRSLEHVFTLLALVLPREPLGAAFGGLQSGDPRMRGLALEYLESVLPEPLREALWPHLDAPASPAVTASSAGRDRAVILAELLRGNQSLAMERPHREPPGTAPDGA